MGLTKVGDYNYISGGKAQSDNQAMYQELMGALDTVGFAPVSDLVQFSAQLTNIE